MDELMETDAGKRKLAKIQKSVGSMDYGGEKSFAGCTATVILVTPTEIYCANSGDSRTVLSKSTKVVELSKDHKPDDEIELRRIQNAGGYVEDSRVNGILALSRALGDFEYKNNTNLKAKDQAVTALPDIKCVPITTDTEFVLLACDGVWDVKESQEGVTFFHNKVYKNHHKPTMKQLEQGMEGLLDDCCAKDLTTSEGLGCDNITAIIVEINH